MPDPVTRLNTALEGRYRIERTLGEGGMATVYLADDIRHERKVAVKVLKPELAAVVGAERFLAEIKTTANLQHPHILPLFDSGEADSFLFYVMPYVEGETLRDRINRDKQLPVDEAVRVAIAVANALHTAHEQGIVHRDIKPANILLSRGEPLVADFGIALAVGAAGGSRLTETGLSVGTPFYMSPEQATGDQGVGPQTDIYALGAVLYEMLVGDPPYIGSTAQAVLGKIIQGEPVSATSIRRSIPANVDAAIRKALEKLPADRFMRAQDLTQALADPGFRHGEALDDTSAPAPKWTPARLATAGAALGLTLLAGLGLGWAMTRQPTPTPPLFRTVLVGDSLHRIANACCGPSIASSHDGRTLAFLVRRASGTLLYVRRLDEFAGRPIEGTEEARTPFLSPDGRWLGFVKGGVLMKTDLQGGTPLTIADVGTNRIHGANWTEDGDVLFSPIPADGEGRGIFRVSSQGGTPERLTVPDSAAGEIEHALPQMLPAGRGILYVIWPSEGRDQAAAIGVLDLQDNTLHRLTPGIQPYYAETGHLVFALADGSIMAQPFDVETLTLEGEPVRIGEGVVTHDYADTEYAVSRSGTFVHRTGVGNDAILRQFTIAGVQVESFEGSLPRFWPRFSPDGRQLVYGQAVDSRTSSVDLWLLDLETGIDSRFTTGGGYHVAPIWSADGRDIRYAQFSEITAAPRFMTRPADMSGPAAPFGDDDGSGFLGIPARSGGPIPFVKGASGEDQDLWVMDAAGFNPRPFLETEFVERLPAVSPSGRWIAYSSDQSARAEVYVQPFPDGGAVSRVSTEGGRGPVWLSDEQLVYQSFGGDLVRADIELSSGRVRATGHSVIVPEVAFHSVAHNYDVSPDGGAVIVLSGIGTPELRVEVNRLQQLVAGGSN